MSEKMNYSTPSTPNSHIQKIKEGEPKINYSEQVRYRTRTGTILYLMQKCRPDLSNMGRDPSKLMVCGTQGDMNALERAIKFIKQTENLGLRFTKGLHSGEKTHLEGYVDSDWAGNKDNRRSVSGWMIFLDGNLVNWGSRQQSHVTLSSTTAKYIALTDITKEIKYTEMICEFMGMEIRKPIIVVRFS